MPRPRPSSLKVVVNELNLVDTVLGTGVGGTGPTCANTGEILVGDRNASLSRLGSGYDGQVLVANSAAPLGVEWDTITIKTTTTPPTRICLDGVDTNRLVAPSAVKFILNNAPTISARRRPPSET